MKFILLALFIPGTSFAALNTWSDLEAGERYKLKRDINLTLSSEQQFFLKKGTRLKLVEESDLSMIKVKLQKFKVEDCESNNLQTDLELISIDKKTENEVGMSIAKGCVLEVFVERRNLNKKSPLL